MEKVQRRFWLQQHVLFCTDAWHQVLAAAAFDCVRIVRDLAACANLKRSLKYRIHVDPLPGPDLPLVRSVQ